LRQTRWPLSFAAQFAGVVGHDMAADVVAVGVGVSCRGRIAAKAPVAGSRASMKEALIVCAKVFVCLFVRLF
jgi:hypothetical protein